MYMDIDTLLGNSISTCESIKKIKFKNDGIFTNSVVKDKDITTLITDLNIELPNDGKNQSKKRKYFLSYDAESKMLTRYDGAQYYEDEKYYSGDYNNNEVTIKVPKEQSLDTLSMGNNYYLLNRLEEVSTKLRSLLSKNMHESNISLIEEVSETNYGDNGNREDNYDVNLEQEYLNQLVDILLKLNHNYPINNLESYLNKLKSKNETLSKELAELKDINRDIKLQLKKLNINLDEKQLLQFQIDKNSSSAGKEKPVVTINGRDIILKKKKQLEELKRHKESLLSS